MFEQRLEFLKLGRARFLSHLDTMRVFQRALTRACIPVMYSQGFNPHMKLSIAFPLPLGVESVCEMIDIKLEYPVSGVVDKLNAALPEGFQILRTLPLFNLDKITYIRYELVFNNEFEDIFDGRALVVQKKTKRGFEDLNITGHVRRPSLCVRRRLCPAGHLPGGAVPESPVCRDGVSPPALRIDLSVKPPQISPAHVLAALRIYYPKIEMVGAKRLEMVM